MSKGLEALENIKENCDLFDEGYQWDNEFSKQFDLDIDTIEKELKEGENYKAMYRLEHEKNQQLSQANLKTKKALEIIKYKQINVYSFIQRKPKTFEEYQDIDDEIEQLSEASLSKEEYNLLKEVLL